jgi:hypothetical protein
MASDPRWRGVGQVGPNRPRVRGLGHVLDVPLGPRHEDIRPALSLTELWCSAARIQHALATRRFGETDTRVLATRLEAIALELGRRRMP